MFFGYLHAALDMQVGDATTTDDDALQRKAQNIYLLLDRNAAFSVV